MSFGWQRMGNNKLKNNISFICNIMLNKRCARTLYTHVYLYIQGDPPEWVY